MSTDVFVRGTGTAASGRRRRWTGPLLAVLVVVGGALLVYEPPSSGLVYDPESRRPDGLAVTVDVLEELGVEVEVRGSLPTGDEVDAVLAPPLGWTGPDLLALAGDGTRVVAAVPPDPEATPVELAFTGVGLLLLLNRLVPKESLEWGQWVMLLAWGGFFGNFGLSLVDHAQNGFFYVSEWVPVVVAAVTVGVMIIPIFLRVPASFYRVVAAVLVVAAVTGVVGFVLHVTPALTEDAGSLRDRVVHGAPIFAPLLFTNLALLGALGVWDLWAKDWVTAPAGAAAAEGGDEASAEA